MAAVTSELLSVAQMRQADAAAMAAGVDFDSLMDNAGGAVAARLMQRWSARPTLVLCGPGNNGGDGLVVARTLASAGWPVRVASQVSRAGIAAALEGQARRWKGSFEMLEPAVIEGASLVVDGLYGAGLNRPLDGPAAAVLRSVAQRGLPVVAIDVPSGLDGDTGQANGAIAAELTVTFFRRKPGHLLGDGPALCGELAVAGIGIPESVLADLGIDTFENGPALLKGESPAALRAVAAPTTAREWELAAPPPPGSGEGALSHARLLAQRSGKVTMLSGPCCLLADPGGVAVIHPGRLPSQTEAALRDTMAAALKTQGIDARGKPLWLRLAGALWAATASPG